MLRFLLVSAVGLFQQCLCLLQGILAGIGPAVCSDEFVSGQGIGAALILESLLDMVGVSLDEAGVPLAFGVGSISMLQGYSKVSGV